MIEGVDLSAFNAVPDWSKVPEEIGFVYLRGTVRGSRDSRFKAHWDAAINAARPCGAYSFEYVDGDPKDEAKAFIDSDAINMVLPPALDLETMNGRGAVEVLAYARQWLDIVEQASSRTPVLYTGPSFWMQLGALGKDPSWARYPLWIAHYGASKPIIPAPWNDYTFWQYAGNTIKNAEGKVIASPGLVPGIVGEVDRNKFNGNLADLHRLAGFAT